MKKQNKEAVERLKKKKEKDLGDKLKDLPDGSRCYGHGRQNRSTRRRPI